jgi:hypothetical protein
MGYFPFDLLIILTPAKSLSPFIEKAPCFLLEPKGAHKVAQGRAGGASRLPWVLPDLTILSPKIACLLAILGEEQLIQLKQVYPSLYRCSSCTQAPAARISFIVSSRRIG